jgi:signal transduction histidine kinase/ActR/RegA family two-component response regulator
MNKAVRMSGRELADHPAWGELASDAGQWHPTGGWLAAPLTGRDGRNLGLIELCDKKEGDFTEDDEAALVQLAQMCSIAVENTIYAAERETNRIKDEFLSTLSHELRTPLNAILGWTQLLQIEQLPQEVAHGLEVIDRNARAQTKLIEDLLDVSRITTGKLQLTLRPTVLGPVIQAAADSVRPLVESRHISVDCVLEAAETVVEGDADRLQQVCWNLFSNAAKFTPERGRITVRLEAADGIVHLTVRDSGRGIDPAFLPYVFDRFRQADSTSTRSHGGLGIGLTIVRRIVQLHGGTVEAFSEGEGSGATFTVSLPMAPTNGNAKRRMSPAQGPAEKLTAVDLRGMRVLIVDDEPDARDVAATALSRAGASVTQAGSVDEALAAFELVRPDVLITDIAMPEKDGYDLVREVRRRTPAEGRDVPAIALTAYARVEDRARALAAGFQQHLVKPVNPPMLARIVGQFQKASIPVANPG